MCHRGISQRVHLLGTRTHAHAQNDKERKHELCQLIENSFHVLLVDLEILFDYDNYDGKISECKVTDFLRLRGFSFDAKKVQFYPKKGVKMHHRGQI